ncbi:hypothetical protein Naga_101228g1 [Nannochloropsis gaditana]|uniref:Uncharacterized protein n=1 Tax=Nannochloropsis gaditana TaxID=72520 RepID=W7SZ91_9STRA|nr:hypothetical protein Naga_101228g1 [Nannochloropsis gaditana]
MFVYSDMYHDSRSHRLWLQNNQEPDDESPQEHRGGTQRSLVSEAFPQAFRTCPSRPLKTAKKMHIYMQTVVIYVEVIQKRLIHHETLKDKTCTWLLKVE